MKKALVICGSMDRAREYFSIVASMTNVTKASGSNLKVWMEDMEYHFISTGKAESIRGQTYSQILIDQSASLTEEEEAFYWSRLQVMQ